MLLLLDLGNDILALCLPFCDARDLSIASSCCRALKRLSEPEWERRDEASPEVGKSDASTARERVMRSFKALQLARLMEKKSNHHLLGTLGTPCEGCDGFPNLDMSVFDDREQYEFFVRFAYKETPPGQNPCIWQGFVPLRPAALTALLANFVARGLLSEREYNTLAALDISSPLLLNINDIYPYMQWNAMEGFGQNSQADLSDLVMALDAALSNVIVSIVAVHRLSQQLETSLVLVTHGVQGMHFQHGEENCFKMYDQYVMPHNRTGTLLACCLRTVLTPPYASNNGCLRYLSLHLEEPGEFENEPDDPLDESNNNEGDETDADVDLDEEDNLDGDELDGEDVDRDF